MKPAASAAAPPSAFPADANHAQSANNIPQAAHTPTRVKQTLFSLALWALFFALLLAAFSNAGTVAGYYPGLSLRYHTPFTGQQAYGARQHAFESADMSFWPTFWREDKAAFSGDLFKAEGRCIRYSGEGAMVWPAAFTAGAWPGATDEGGCVVSAAMAQRLWGSGNVVGKTLHIDDKPFIVRGVFKGDEDLALASVGDRGTAAGWQAAELQYPGGEALRRTDAESFALAAGLGAPDTILSRGGVAATAEAMAVLPAILLALLALAQWVITHGKMGVFHKVLLAGGLVAFVLLLPGLLALLPPWLIPGKWSDFSFWGSLLRQFIAGVREYFSVWATARDVAGQMHMLAQVLLLCAALTLATALALRPNPRKGAQNATPAKAEPAGITPALPSSSGSNAANTATQNNAPVAKDTPLTDKPHA